MKSMIMIAAIFIVFLGVAGLLIFYDSSSTSQAEQNPEVAGVNAENTLSPAPNSSPSASPSSLRIRLQTLLSEHTVLTGRHLESYYDDLAVTETEDALNENSLRIAELAAELGASEQAFLSMWDKHIDGYENYTKSLRDKDERTQTVTKAELDTLGEEMGQMIHKLIPAATIEEVTDLMNEHIALTLSIIEAHAKGDQAEKLTQEGKATIQAVKFANTLSDAIENPNN